MAHLPHTHHPAHATEPTPQDGLDAALPPFFAAFDRVADILYRAKALGDKIPNRTFTCQVAQRPTADTPLVRTFVSASTHCFPITTTTAHARMALADLAHAYTQACDDLVEALTRLTFLVGRQTRPGLVQACALGVRIHLDLAKSNGWFLPGDHTHSVAQGYPFSGHSVDTGAFEDMLRVVAAADGWHEGPEWQITGAAATHLRFQARDAESALLRAWALHNPHLFEPYETRRVTMTRVEPSVDNIADQCRARLAHTAGHGRSTRRRVGAHASAC